MGYGGDWFHVCWGAVEVGLSLLSTAVVGYGETGQRR
jgi:hypothetical protein